MATDLIDQTWYDSGGEFHSDALKTGVEKKCPEFAEDVLYGKYRKHQPTK
jgi:hypothetical protein